MLSCFLSLANLIFHPFHSFGVYGAGKWKFNNWVIFLKSSLFTLSLCLEFSTDAKTGKCMGKGTVAQFPGLQWNKLNLQQIVTV